MSAAAISIQSFLQVYSEIASCAAVVLNIILIISIFRVNIFSTHLRLLLANIIGMCIFHLEFSSIIVINTHTHTGCVLLISTKFAIIGALDKFMSSTTTLSCIIITVIDRFVVRSVTPILAIVAYDRFVHAHSGALNVIPVSMVRDCILH
jgi:hypothetical protein